MTERLLADLGYPPASPARAEAAQEARSALLAAARGERTSRRRRARRRRWPLLVAVGLSALAALVALVPLARLTDPEGSLRADAAAARVLEGTARAAAARPPVPAPGPGQYLYTRSRSTFLNGYASFLYLLDVERESWIGADGSLSLRQRSRNPRFATARDRAAWGAAGRPRLEQGHDGVVVSEPGQARRAWAEVLSDVELVRLAEDPAALARRIGEVAVGHGPSLEEEMFVIVGDLLRESTVPPAGRAGVWRAAAYLPGVELLDGVRDPVGRPGLALAREQDGLRSELVFDPDAATLLAERQVISDEDNPYGPDYAVGTAVSATTYLAQRLVSSAPSPEGRSR